jgi:hypothetical protein
MQSDRRKSSIASEGLGFMVFFDSGVESVCVDLPCGMTLLH